MFLCISYVGCQHVDVCCADVECILCDPFMHCFSNCLFSFLIGNLSSLVVPAAALGALGYGYMWWKVGNCLHGFLHTFLNNFISLWLMNFFSLFLLFQYCYNCFLIFSHLKVASWWYLPHNYCNWFYTFNISDLIVCDCDFWFLLSYIRAFHSQILCTWLNRAWKKLLQI